MYCSMNDGTKQRGFHKSKEWIRNNTNIIEKHTLETLCETRWYSMTKVCLGVATYEQFFFDSLQKQGKVDGYPAVNKNITDLISRRHFTDNEDLLKALKPIADAIGTLESMSTTIASIFLMYFDYMCPCQRYPKISSFNMLQIVLQLG